MALKTPPKPSPTPIPTEDDRSALDLAANSCFESLLDPASKPDMYVRGYFQNLRLPSTYYIIFFSMLEDLVNSYLYVLTESMNLHNDHMKELHSRLLRIEDLLYYSHPNRKVRT